MPLRERQHRDRWVPGSTFIDVPGGIQDSAAGLLRIVDGGPAGSGQESFEWAFLGGGQFVPFPGPPPDALPGPTDCATFPGPFPSPRVETLTSIDFVVIDAPALPSSTAQCKNGGWRNFGVFKNQGDCVSYVATGDKNPPSGP